MDPPGHDHGAHNRAIERDEQQESMAESNEARPKRRSSDLYFPPRQRPYYPGSTYERQTRRPPFDGNVTQAQDLPIYPQQREIIPFSPVILLTPSHHHPPGISFVDVLTCQNVELFQSVQDYHHGRNAGYVGLRCIHCARSDLTDLDSTSVVYPSSIEMMESSLRVMAKNHFLQCVMLPESIRAEFHNYEIHRHLDEYEQIGRNDLNQRNALSDYCMDVCARVNIINRMPPQTGIVVGITNYSPRLPTNFASATTNQAQRLGDGRGMAQYYPFSSLQQDPPFQSFPNSFHTRRTFSVAGADPNIPQFPLHSHPNQAPSKEGSFAVVEGSSSIPFVQTAKNVWECKFCSNLPIGHRAEKHAWYSAAPPPHFFMDLHLRECTGKSLPGSRTAPSPGRMRLNQGQGLDISPYRFHPTSDRSFNPNPHLYSNIGNSPSRANVESPNSPPMHWRQQPSSYGYPHPVRRDHSRSRHSIHHQQRNLYDMQDANSRNITNLESKHGNKSLSPAVVNPGVNQSGAHSNRPATEGFEEAIKYLSEVDSSRAPNEQPNEILVEEGDRRLITDYFYYIMRQLRMCSFKEEDRKTRGGKHNSIPIGYRGLECTHCAHTASARRFFWSNVDLLSNSFSEIPGHVLRCKACPNSTKDALLELKKHHHLQMAEMPRGSQKTFLRRVWRRLHEEIVHNEEHQVQDERDILPSSTIVSVDSLSPGRDGAIKPRAQSIEYAAKALANNSSSKEREVCVLLAIDEDKEWGLTDLDCLVRKNIELFCASDRDAANANQTKGKGDDIYTGQVGLRCAHCTKSPEREAHCIYPESIDDIFNCVQVFKKKHFLSCPYFPQDQKEKFESFKEKSPSSYGSIVREYFLKSAEALGLQDNASGGIDATGIYKPFKRGDQG